MLEILSPYLLFISGFIVICINLIAIFKRITLVQLVILNIIITLVMNVIGLGQYDLITTIIKELSEFAIRFFKDLWNSIT